MLNAQMLLTVNARSDIDTVYIYVYTLLKQHYEYLCVKNVAMPVSLEYKKNMIINTGEKQASTTSINQLYFLFVVGGVGMCVHV